MFTKYGCLFCTDLIQKKIVISCRVSSVHKFVHCSIFSQQVRQGPSNSKMTGVLKCLLVVAVIGVCMAKDREFEEFVEKHQHLIPEETRETLIRERRAGDSRYVSIN